MPDILDRHSWHECYMWAVTIFLLKSWLEFKFQSSRDRNKPGLSGHKVTHGCQGGPGTATPPELRAALRMARETPTPHLVSCLQLRDLSNTQTLYKTFN